MSVNAINLLGPNPVGERLALWIRNYPAKELAQMFGVEERTARGWRDGNFPQSKHMTAMVERWGIDFLEDIYSPILAKETTAEQHLERIEHHIKALRSKGVRFTAIIGLIATFSSFGGDMGDDNPMVRVPRPASGRSIRVRRDGA